MAELENVKKGAGEGKSASGKPDKPEKKASEKSDKPEKGVEKKAPGKSDKPEKNAEKKPANKKPNIFARAGKFLKSCVTELKKVTWLSRQSTVRYSALVIVAVVLIAAVIGAFDYLCAWVINSLGLLV